MTLLKHPNDSVISTQIFRGILVPSVAQIFARHPVYDNIFCRLPSASFARMSRVCRDVREATMDFATRAYNIDRKLRRYFSDPLDFRALMSRTGLIISGSFALQFFDRSFYPESDLDLYVWSGESAPEVGRWLEMEGYTYKPSPTQRTTVDAHMKALANSEDVEDEWDDVYGAIHALFSFEKVIRNIHGLEDTRKIQVIVPGQLHNSPLQTVLTFHSTCVMNVITYDAAYALYPYATFELSKSLVVTEDCSERTESALQKYAARGFRLVYPSFELAENNPPDFFIDEIQRRVADKHSWRIPLQVDGLPEPLNRGKGRYRIPIEWQIETHYDTYRIDCLGGSSI
ncbi:hypothetical protein K466DRAFT_520274 [Polyporus arcularius HHB13444]|uniref:F-box domain-containing protein n=1 Tax=Polyporus arcularius HHB13444 TaxID=1314778 RepID=A0A5C3PI49_9APHY|nr:hypothetical protein K466DRAFT_520274 [Polyporus arcularius HHB13444]